MTGWSTNNQHTLTLQASTVTREPSELCIVFHYQSGSHLALDAQATHARAVDGLALLGNRHSLQITHSGKQGQLCGSRCGAKCGRVRCVFNCLVEPASRTSASATFLRVVQRSLISQATEERDLQGAWIWAIWSCLSLSLRERSARYAAY
jgi:hypothetical protein